MYLGGGWLLTGSGTQRGFLLIMIFWSLPFQPGLAANYGCPRVFGLAFALVMLLNKPVCSAWVKGGGFPGPTRVVAEWFPVRERSTAMGLINAGTAWLAP